MKLHLLYALAVIGLTGYADYRGWSFSRVNEVKNVPKSVRDNPGIYRSIYRPIPHYIGGK